MANPYTRVARLRTPDDFRGYLQGLGVQLPFDEILESGDDAPLIQTYTLENGRVIGNRFSILPMEGWDGTVDGLPTDKTTRRWNNFGLSGAKLIWGGEAVAVRHDGRANPNQLMIAEHTLTGLEKLRTSLVDTHNERFVETDDLVVGLQLTHSGRFARPNKKTRLEPKILYHHPVLEEIYRIDPNLPVLTDAEIEDLIGEFIRAAKQAYEIGFDFVDIKHCHGYLGHEFLSAYTRPGKFGGSFENRTRFLREIVAGIRSTTPGLMIGVRVSAYDFPSFQPDSNGVGQPLEYRDEDGRYPFAFGSDPANPLQINLDETFAFLELLKTLDIELVNLSAGSPYYNPHIQRPAYFPPSDGYQPPEDPLVGVARQINNVAAIKSKYPGLAIVGTGYSYLQEWLPHVGQYFVRTGKVDFVGLGRMALSYPEMPADVIHGKPLQRKKICRTFSDCTTAPRCGLISGCYPLDDYYKSLPEAGLLNKFKVGLK
jgi:2,4-dienoyl-CoA reductase-like NADH-dependent reductase (Old Yellow Enzyme family)